MSRRRSWPGEERTKISISLAPIAPEPVAEVFSSLRRNTYPVVASNLMGLFLNFMELYYAGALGPASLAGVSVAVTWTTLVFSFSLASYSSGVTREAAFRQDDEPALRSFIFTELVGALAIGAVIAGVIALSAPTLLLRTGLTSESLREGVVFLRLIVLSFPCLFLLGGFQGLMRGIGEPRTPYKVVALTTALTLVLSPPLAFAWGLGLGVAGTAFATDVAVVAAAGYALYLLSRWRPGIVVAILRSPRLQLDGLIRVLQVAIPSALVWLIVAVTIALLQVVVSRFGERFLVAFSLVMRLEHVIGTVASAYGAALLYVTATYYSRREVPSALRSIRIQQFFFVVCVSPVVVWFEWLPRTWAMLFTDDSCIIDIAALNVRYFVLGLPFMGLAQIIGFSFFVFGRPLWSLGVITVKNFMLTIPVLTLLIVVLGIRNHDAIFASQVAALPCAWLLGEALLRRLQARLRASAPCV